MDGHRQAPLLAAAELLGCLLEGQATKAHLMQDGLCFFARQAPLTQAQFLADGQPQEMAFGELKDQAAQPAALTGVDRLAMPADLPLAGVR